jgi:hypothetical protein
VLLLLDELMDARLALVGQLHKGAIDAVSVTLATVCTVR